ncbi:MAG TPA: NUDIX domain-containing protein [Verrucomicrobiota bacterium]|nr:NUDIX domain-containing protein [Verrucomicrobiota bacterium]
MAMPYKIATLLYCFNPADKVLLLHRAQEPNRGLWSPCGGKLIQARGESPYACACREAFEEIGLTLQPADLHLTGLVSEHGYQGQAHWLMFLFEVRPRIQQLPAPHAEGRFRFFSKVALGRLRAIPRTDRERIWPWFWQHRGGFFAAHCRCLSNGRHEWHLEESVPMGAAIRNLPTPKHKSVLHAVPPVSSNVHSVPRKS